MLGRILNRMGRWAGRGLAHWLNAPTRHYERRMLVDSEALFRIIRPGDIVLVEGDTRVSGLIKYITQSTWSHAALFVGKLPGRPYTAHKHWLIEADLEAGVRAVPLAMYLKCNLRICRPIGLSREDCAHVCESAIAQIGHRYDLKNVIDLGRYLLPWKFVPRRLHGRALRFGSGDPTRAICSSVLAQAFQGVHYPILPHHTTVDDLAHDWLSRRHFTLFMPRDFDLSPYFQIVKPTVETEFDYHRLHWMPAAWEQESGEN